MIKSDSIAKIAPALLAAQKEMGNAKKEAKNPFFKSVYADLNSVREAVTPALHTHRVSLLQPMVHVEGRNFIETMLLHESGEFVSSLTEVICKEERNPQALGSAISYARRYGLSAMLSVGAEDNDGEGAMDRKPAKPAKAAPVIQSGSASSVSGVGTSITTKIVPGTPTSEVVTKPSFRKAAKPEVTAPVVAKSNDSENLEDWIS